MTQNLIELMQNSARCEGSGIRFIEGAENEQFLSYRDLSHQALRIAVYLQNLGLKRGDELVLQIEDNERFITVFWGALLLGLIPVPVSVGNNEEHRLKLIRIWKILDHPYLITNERVLKNLQKFAGEKAFSVDEIAEKTILLEDLAISLENVQEFSFVPVLPNPGDIAFIQFSSGSTGDPKGVILTHENLLTNIRAIIQGTSMTEKDSFLSWMPLTHDMGLIGCHLSTLALGLNLYLMPTALFIRRPVLWIKKAHEYRASVLVSPNFGYKYFLEYFRPEVADDWDLSAVRLIVNGAEPISVKLSKEFMEILKPYKLCENAMFPVYGMAEASLAVTFPPVGENQVAVNLDRRYLNIGASVKESAPHDPNWLDFADVGCPVENCAVRICDGENWVVSDKVVGYIQIKGKNVTSGYYNNPEATAAAITADGWLNTGDLGFYHAGRLVITGRAKDIIFINGQNYYPHDVERVAEEISGVELGRVAACGVFNENVQKEEIVLFVYYKKKAEDFAGLAVEIKKLINRKMGLEVKAVLPVREIPKTTSGKVQRYKLAEAYKNGEFSEVESELTGLCQEMFADYSLAVPTDEVEACLLEIWREVLGVERIGIDDNFFELGGQSLKATILASRIHKEFNVEIPLTKAFECSTIRALARYIKGVERDIYSLIKPVERREYYPLSSAQKRLLILNQLENVDTSYNIPIFMLAEGELDKDKFAGIFTKLIKRHEALRTGFEFVNGEPVQHVYRRVDFQVEYFATTEENLPSLLKSFVQPFTLSKPPLLRVGLALLETNRHLLLLDMHHIISDGTSLSILIKELADLYAEEELPELTLQYKDFACWQEELLSKGALQKQEEYWLERFRGELPVLNLSTDYPRPVEQNYAGDSVMYEIEEETAHLLKALAEESGTTLYMIVLAAYNTLLWKITGQKDIIIGSPVAGRPHADLEKIVGMFVNTLAMRNQPRGDKIFSQFLQEVKANSLQAFENQDYPFDELVEKLGVKRELGRNPLFDTIFNFQNIQNRSYFAAGLEGVRFIPYDYRATTAKFDLTLIMFEDGEKLQLECSYRTSLFKHSTVEYLMSEFGKLLIEIGVTPDKRIKDYRLCSKKHAPGITQLVKPQVSFTEFSKEEINSTLVQRFEEQVGKYPTQPAIKVKETVLTYTGLNREANQLARVIEGKYDDRFKLSREEKDRYTRQMALMGWGVAAQEKLKSTTVFVGGAGGSGSPTVIQLALLGIGRIIIADYDEVELSNLNRQCLHNLSRLGMNKALSAKLSVEQINPEVEVIVHSEKITRENVAMLVGDAAIIFDNVDDLETKFILSEYAVAKQIPHIIASMIDISSYAAIFHTPHTPCFHCLYDVEKVKEIAALKANVKDYKKVPNPVAAPALFLSTGFVCNEAVKIILGLSNPAYNRYFFFNQQASEQIVDSDGYKIITYTFSEHFKNISQEQGFAWELGWRENFVEELVITPNPDCPVCGKKADTTGMPHREAITPKEFTSDISAEIDKRVTSERKNCQTVALLFGHNEKMVIGIMGALKAAKTYVPLDPTYPLERLIYMLDDSEARLVVTDSANMALAQKLCDKTNQNIAIINIDALRQSSYGEVSAENLHKLVEPDEVVYILYTSGSTGRPKGVLQNHRNVLHFIRNYTNNLKINPADKLTQLSSYSFDAAVMDIFGALLNGATLYPYDIKARGQMENLRSFLTSERISIYHSVPSVYRYFLQTLQASDILPEVRLVVLGGEAVVRKDVEEFKKHFASHCLMINGLGPTESTVTLQYFLDHGTEISNNAVPVGYPVEDTEVFLLTEDNEEAGVYGVGEIVYKSEYLALGYWNLPEKTRQVFIKDPRTGAGRVYLSGDLGRLLADGSIEFLGRNDRQIKIRGYRVELGEIEAILDNLSEVKKSAVVAFPGEGGESYLAAYYVPAVDWQVSPELLTEHLEKELPEYMIPAYFVSLNELPLTPNGKIERKKLPAPDASGGVALQYLAASNELEQKLVHIWQGILGVEKVSVLDSFIELGGHSLKATSLISRVHKEFNVEMPLQEVYKLKNIQQMAKYIGTADENIYASIPQVPMQEYYPLSSAQRRLFVLAQFDNSGISYNIPRIMMIEGNLNTERFNWAFTELVKRHETLRTSFELVAGEPVQRVMPEVDFHIAAEVCQDVEQEKYLHDTIQAFIRPFDLRKPPLMRVKLIHLSPEKHVLLFDMHHIISDGSSMGIIVKEFLALYQSQSLPALKVQYKDFAVWQNELLNSELLKKQETFWLNTFQGEIPVLAMPTDFPRPSTRSFAGNKYKFRANRELTQKLYEFGRQTETTLYMGLLAAYNLLLSRYTGQRDLIIGSPIAGRAHADLENVVGIFINMLAMRNYPEGNKTLGEFLAELKENVFQAYAHQDYQFEELVLKLDIVRDMSRNPLFDTVLALQNVEIGDIASQGLKFYPYEFEYRIAKFDFVLIAVEEQGGIDFTIEYCEHLFKHETIVRLAENYLTTLTNMVGNLEVLLKEIDILPFERKKQILQDFNNVEIVYAEKNLGELFREQVAKTPLRTAVVAGERELTYQELNAEAAGLAGYLREKGVGRDKVVGLMTNRSVEMISGIFGIGKAGGAYLPIDASYPQSRINAMLNDSNVEVLVTQEKVFEEKSYTSLQGIEREGLSPELTCRRMQIKDFDAVPLPDRTLIDYSKYTRYIGQAMVKNTISLQATRGCPYNCAYCHKVWPKTHVTRSAENIFEEIKLFYTVGIRRFVFVDDAFNLDIKNSSRLFKLIIKSGMKLQMFFPNGLRGDILTKDYIDFMVEAGVVDFSLALETASPRLQKLIGKNLQLDKFRANAEYVIEKYPEVILEMATMHGFPTETEAEAMLTLEFIKSLKWIHFPYIHILKIYPDTDMARLAMEHGVSREAIERAGDLTYHEIPETLPFPKSFTLKYRSEFLNEYFLSPERLKKVLPVQMKLMKEDEIIQKYNSYLPVEIRSFADLLNFAGISREELTTKEFLDPAYSVVPDFNARIKPYFPEKVESSGALRILLLDLSQYFSTDVKSKIYNVAEPPLGLMYLLTYLNEKLGSKVYGKIAKAQMDFDSYGELQALIAEFKPDVIGVRSLTLYRDFFHKTTGLIRQWGIKVPIIAGGPYATSGQLAMLRDENIDLAVLGEGEVTFTEIIEQIIAHRGLPPEAVLQAIPGIAYIADKDKARRRAFCRQIVLVDYLPKGVWQDVPLINQPDDLAYVIYTSGSTGKPKGVMVEQRNVQNLVVGLQESIYARYGEHLRVALVASYIFDASVQQIFEALLYGHTLCLVPDDVRVDGKNLLRYYQEKSIDISDGTPTHIRLLTQALVLEEARIPVKHFIIGGEALPAEVVQGFLRFFPADKPLISNIYGPTECCVDSTVFLIAEEKLADFTTVPIGRPLANQAVYILDASLQIVPLGVNGELYIAGKGVGRGYVNLPDLQAERFVQNPFVLGERMYRTGDLAKWLPDGNIEYAGRVDNQVKVRGYRIEPGEIEKQLLRHPGISDVVVVDFRETSGSSYLAAYYVAGGEIPLAELREHLSSELPFYMLPSYFIRLEKLPVNRSGKIDRSALPEPGGKAKSGTEYIAPGTQVEARLVDIWKELLGVEWLGVNDNFFELGGHSLKATTLVALIHKEFKTDIALREIFKSPTIRELAKKVQSGEKSSYTAIKKAEEREYYQVSSAQKRLFVFSELDAENTSYNMPGVFILRGSVDKVQFMRAVRLLVGRHEALRTSFDLVDGKPVQRIWREVECELEFTPGREDEIGEVVAAHLRPFNLRQAPLLRVKVVSFTEDKHLLLFDMHHIISDGISMGVLISELGRLYAGIELPPLPIQYKDFSEWQNNLFTAGAFAKAEEYWQTRFTGELPVLKLPTDYPRPRLQSFNGDRIQFNLSKEVTHGVYEVATQAGATVFMVLLAAYNVFLARYSGQEDIIIGSPVAGRPHADLHEVIGVFVNTLPFRNYPKWDKTFTEFLQEVKEHALAGFEQQDYPLERLVEKLDIRRDLSRNPLFDTVFVLQNMDIPEVALKGLTFKPYDLQKKTAKFDLTLEAVESEIGIKFTLEYCTDLFKPESVQRMSRDYLKILTDLTANPELKIKEFELTEQFQKMENQFLQEVEFDF